jgi:WD40 repeat protein
VIVIEILPDTTGVILALLGKLKSEICTVVYVLETHGYGAAAAIRYLDIDVTIYLESTLATGSFDGTAKVWDPGTGKELFTLAGHGGSVWAIAFSPDGKLIATGSKDQIVRL